MTELPTLYIPRKIYQKLMHWVDKSNFEVSWFGMLRFEKAQNYFVVDEIFLLDQENSSAETEIKAAALCDLLYDTRKMPGDLRWWGHSHVKMGVFWSGTDMKTMKELSQNGWFLSTVFNQKREMKTAYMQGGDIPLMLNDLPTVIYDPVFEEDKKEWDALYDKHVKNKTYHFTKQSKTSSAPETKENFKKIPAYNAEEYKIINKMLTGQLNSEEFIEAWEAVSNKLPPESVLIRSEEGRKVLKHFEEKDEELTEAELEAWLEYIKTKDDDESVREAKLIAQTLASKKEASDEDIESFFLKMAETTNKKDKKKTGNGKK